MKIILTTCFLWMYLLAASQCVQSISQAPNALYTVNANANAEVSVSGQSGIIQKSETGTNTYNNQNSRSASTMRGICFLPSNSDLGWVVGDRGIIRHSTDGGATWVQQYSPTGANLNDVLFDNARAITVGGCGTILRSTNQGNTWAMVASGTSDTLRRVTIGLGKYITVGDNGIALSTTDNGSTWSRITNLNTTENLLDVAHYQGVIWAVGKNHTIRKSEDNGVTWQSNAGLGSFDIHGVAALSKDTCIMVGTGGNVIVTLDGGNQWYDITNPAVFSDINDVDGQGLSSAFAAGADGSIIRINLPLTGDYKRTLCFGESVTINGNIYDVNNPTGIEQIRGVANSCDSILSVDLAFYPEALGTTMDSFCMGGNFMFPDGTQTSMIGDHDILLPNASINGCDSTVTYTLTQTAGFDVTETVRICEGATYALPDGQVVTAENQYTTMLRSAVGCDSLVTTDLSFFSPAVSTLNDNFCTDTDYILPDGRTVSAPDTYEVMLPAASVNGCDSTITIILDELQNFTRTETVSICNGEQYTLPDGRVIATSDSYLSTFMAANGCDSVIITNLTILPIPSGTVTTETICEGETFQWNGNTIQTAGNYSDTLSNVNGCDSIIFLELMSEGISTLGAANAGNDISVCEDMVDLFATDLPNTTGTWTAPNGVTVQPQNQGGAVARELQEGVNAFTWTISGTNCADFDSDTILVNYAASGPRLIQDFIKLDTAGNYILDIISNDNLNGIKDFNLELFDVPAKVTNWNFSNATNLLELDVQTRGIMQIPYSVCYASCPDICDTTTIEIFVEGYPDEGETNIIITPLNNDNKNDKLIFDNLDMYPNNNLYIYNRWGNVVYSAAPYKNDWDGSRRGKQLPEGTYYYVMRKQLPDKIQYGSVTIKY